nr:HepT-like ribonuclease domain-containing protein [Frankia sp. Cppng1_Ct_nod]
MRNRIVHGYWSVDVEILHTTAREQLSGFVADLRRVLLAIGEST